MPRSYEDIRKAKLKAELETTTQEVQQMPPGYQAGGRVGFKNSNFIVDPFVMNVRGRLVKLPTQQQVSGQEWTVTRRNGYYYYLYVSQDRSFSVRPSKPVFDETLFAHKHPTSGDRLLGVGFVDDQGEMVYASSHLSIDTHEVTVVASDYVGEDYDYRCDGVADEVEINLAIRYMAASKGRDESNNAIPGGGIVRLSPGTFNLSDEISMLGSITLEGSGYGTRIIPDSTANAQSHGIHVPGTSASPIDGCVIRNLRVQRSARNAEGSGTAPRDIFAEYANNMIIQNNWVIDSPIYGISVTYSKDFLVSGNVVRDAYVVGSAGQAIDIGAGSADTLLSGRVVNNEIYNSGATAASLIGVLVHADGNVLVANNVVRDLLCNGTEAVRGICVMGAACTVSGNLLTDLHNSHDATDGCWAIQLRGAPNCHVVGNTVRGVHGFPNSDLNQAGIGIYLTRESTAVPNDAHIASNLIEDCDQGIFIEDAGTDIYGVTLSGNQVYNCGQLIYRGHCEDVDDEPIIIEDFDAGGYTATLANATWARSDEQAHEGSYSYKITKGASGGDNANAYLQVGSGTTDLHGLIPGVQYTFEAWVYVPSSGGCAVGEAQLRLAAYVSSWGAGSAAATTNDAWEKLSLTYSIPFPTTGTRAAIRMDDLASTGEYFYVDNIRLYPTKHQNMNETLLKDEGTETKF